MRDPILHIRKSDLEKVLGRLGLSTRTSDYSQTAQKIFETATKQKYQLKDRYFVVSKGWKNKKKVEKTIAADNDYTEVFNRVYAALLQQKQMKNMPFISKTSKAYIPLKEAAQMAVKFCEDFQITPIEEGIKDFINIGFEIMGKKFKVEKLQFYGNKIYDIAECCIAIEKDVNPDATKQFFELWQAICKSYTTNSIQLTADHDYVHIVYGRQEADEYKASYRNWITAQFEQLAFLNAIPEMSQLYGANAKRRYDRYMAKKGIKKTEEGTLLNKNVFASPEEEQYFKRLRDKRAT